MAMKSKMTKNDIEDLIKRYKGGEPLYKICKILPCGNKYAKRLLIDHGIKVRDRAESNERVAEDVEEIIRRYKAGESCASIAPDFNLTKSGINQVLIRNKIERRSNSEARGGLPVEFHLEICEQYLNGVKMKELVEKYSISESQVYRILEKNGIERRIYKLTDEQCEEAISLYKGGLSFKAVGEHFGVDKGVIIDLFQRKKLESRSSGETLSIKVEGHIVEEWKELYESGTSVTKIAADSIYCTSLITDRLRKIGVNVRSTNRFLTEDQIDTIIELYKDKSKSVESVANQFNISVATLHNILKEKNENLRVEKINASFEQKIIDAYLGGKSSVQIEEQFQISNSSVGRVLRRNNIQMRSISEAMGGLTDEQEQQVCTRYPEGTSSAELAEEFEVAPTTITTILRRHDIERRAPGAGSDSMYWCLTDGHLFSNIRKTSLYLFHLENYPEYLKLGISFNVEVRSLDEEYGEFVFEYEFEDRKTAFIVEQSILTLLKGKAQCPEELIGEWPGWTEVRLTTEEEMLQTTEWVLSEIEQKGIWQVALEQIEMTSIEAKLCKKRLKSVTPDKL